MDFNRSNLRQLGFEMGLTNYAADGSEKVTGLDTPGRGTSLPGSPVDGQQYYYIADDTNGIEWHLIYDASQGKWRKVGGAPLTAVVDTSESAASTSGFADLTTVGPSVTAPLAGSYIVSVGSRIGGAGANNYDTYMSFAVGGTGAATADSAISGYRSGSLGPAISSVWTERVKTLAASDLIKAKYSSTSSITAGTRWISIDPIYVS